MRSTCGRSRAWTTGDGRCRRPAARDRRGHETDELFYVDLVNTLTAVPVQTSGATFVTANPAKLFETAYAAALTSSRDYDVAPNGQRFLMIRENVARDRSAPVGMVVVQNWFDELKAKVPAGK